MLYAFHLIYLWLPSPEFAVARVAERVRMGGHNVPEETIRQRYHAGLKNFFKLYQPLADTWRMYDNSASGEPRLLSYGEHSNVIRVLDASIWEARWETMAEAIRKDIDKILVEGTEIDKAVKKAVKEAVLRHKQAGNPIVVMKDGQMAWLKPEEIQV
jgi:hypothetical protein